MEAYDPSVNAWTARASLPSTVANAEVGVAGGVLYAVGLSGSVYAFTPP